MFRPSSMVVLLALFAVYLIWGSIYLAMRMAIEMVPPLLMSGLCYLLASAVLLGLLRLRGAGRPSAREWRAAGHGGGTAGLLAGVAPCRRRARRG